MNLSNVGQTGTDVILRN